MYAAGIVRDPQDENSLVVGISYFEGSLFVMGLAPATKEVKDEAGNVIDRIWKITSCGIDA